MRFGPRSIPALALCLLVSTAAADEAVASDGRTPVAIVFEGSEPPEASDMRGWFAVSGEPVEVLTIEKGPAEVVVIRDPAAQAHLDLLAGHFLESRLRLPLPKNDNRLAWDPRILQLGEDEFVAAAREAFGVRRGRLPNTDLKAAREALRESFDLGQGAHVRFVAPRAAPVSRTVEPMNVFNITPSFLARELGFLTFVKRAPSLPHVLRVSDAVALAGEELGESGRRRAVVVMIEGTSADQSLYETASVREHLERSQVPVFVWTFGFSAYAESWSGAREIAAGAGLVDPVVALEQFEVASRELRATLEKQRIVWVAGSHPIWEVRLTAAARGMRLAGYVPVYASAEEGRDGP
ncbi:MAG: hypothetical protein GY719_32025 [bacterium]|nr:hypothetical protein [bacterium]